MGRTECMIANVPEVYFHKSPLLYEPGDRILPGHWGRLVLGTGPNHSRFYFEYIWERIREAEFQDLPSRLRSAFVFTTPEAAVGFDRGVPEFTYTVALAEGARTHQADMSWIEAVKHRRSLDGVDECARHYWRGDIVNPQELEIVVEGELIVQARLTPIPENGTVSAG